MLRFLAIAALFATVLANVSYDGYKVFRVTPKDDLQLDKLVILKNTLKNYVDFWKSPAAVDRPVDMLVRPEYQALVLNLIQGRDLDIEVTVRDLQRDIDDERAGITAGFDYEDFNTLDDINAWMDDLASDYPSLVSVVTVGSSYENRDIKALKIGTSGTNKASVWYEGGIHAREWISPATVIYMSKLLVEGYDSDNEVTAILDDLYVYMLPVYNVDGYAFTWTDDRMWRKTRSNNVGSSCVGTDPNRNWDFQWGGEGSSALKCSDAYRGANPFSEIEVSSVTDYISGLENVKAFIDFHAYGLMWMTPWGYTENLPSDYDEQYSVTESAVAALTAVSGTTYATGSIANTIYIATGSSADWAYGAEGIVHSYAVELRGNSFVINKSNIMPSGIETFEALKYITEYVRTN